MSHFIFLVFQLAILALSSGKRFSIPFNSLLSSSIQSTSTNSSATATATESCKDGVCSITPTNQGENNTLSSVSLEEKVVQEWNHSVNTDNITNPNSVLNDSNDGKVKELIKLGWKESQAKLALNHTKYDLEEAINLLEREEEEFELLQSNIKILNEKHGWKVEAAESALIQTNQNITASLQLLENEEKIVIDNFETAVKDMLDNGWHEFVARQALVTQWTIDQKTAAGINVTFPVESLKNIHPTLKHQNETANVKSSEKSSAKLNDNSNQNKPKPAKKEDCVFDITSENFQKIVVESSVPVILDIYADWCGPCKQLGPILEEAAMNSGGMFRLCKVNSDAQGAIAQTFNVNSLPTVFSISNGKVTDRFIGMLPTDQLQQFLIRCITGYGDRVQKELNDKDYTDYTFKMVNMAGMASMTFRKKEKLYAMLDEAMNDYNPKNILTVTDKTGQANSVTSEESLKTALLYINNAAKDIMNMKYRRISMDSKAYKEKIMGFNHSVKILEIAGFRLNQTAAAVLSSDVTTASGSNSILELNHKNAALLNLITQKLNEMIRNMKFNLKKTTPTAASSASHTADTRESYGIPKNKSLRSKASGTNKQGSKSNSDSSSISTSAPKASIATSSASSSSTSTSSVKNTLKAAAAKITSSPATSLKKSPTTTSTGTTATVKKAKVNKKVATLSSITKSEEDSKPPKKKVSDEKKAQEYFGGDSTVFLSHDDEEDDDDEASDAIEDDEDEWNSVNEDETTSDTAATTQEEEHSDSDDSSDEESSDE